MKVRYLVAFLALTIFTHSVRAAAPTSRPSATRPAAIQGAQTAIETAKAYTNFFKEGQPAKAIETYWDFDAMFDHMFGGKMKEVSATDRESMRRMLRQFLTTIYANPKLIDAMATAEYSGYAERLLKTGETAVDFDVKLTDTTLKNSLVLMKGAGGWRVVDASAGATTLCAALATEFKKNPSATPPAFLAELTSSH